MLYLAQLPGKLNAGEEKQNERSPLLEGAELLVLSDARRREVYSARYRVNAEGYTQWAAQTYAPPPKFCPVGIPPTHTVTVLACTQSSRRARLGHHRFCPSGSPPRRVPGCRRGTPGRKEPEDDTSAQYLRDSDAKIPAAMLARQQKQGAKIAAQTAARES